MTVIEMREPPIALDLAKQHLRVGSATHDDTLIAAKLDMAVAVAEDMTGRTMPVPTTCIERLSVSRTIIPESDYTLLEDDYDPMLVAEPQYGGQTATVTAVVGYDRDNIPPAIKAAILLILGTLYDNESDNLVGRSVSELSLTAEKLLLPWRVTPYGDV